MLGTTWGADPAAVHFVATGGTAPGTIANLTAAQVDATTLSVSYTPASGATDHQERHCPAGTGQWTRPAALDSTSRVGNLSPAVTYDVQVRGKDRNTPGAWSNTASASTATAADNVSGVENVTSSGDGYIDGMLNGVRWTFSGVPRVITFSFPSSGSFYLGAGGGAYGQGEQNNGFSVFTTTQKAVARAALAFYAAVMNVCFVEITEDATHTATIRYANSATPGTAYAYMPSTSPEGGDCWFGSLITPLGKGNYGWCTIFHETGHALGLKHPHESSATFSPMPHSGDGSGLDKDCLEMCLMSYHSYLGSFAGGLTNEANGFPQSAMMYDIAGLQYLYGPNFVSCSGDTSYTFSPTTGQLSINGVGQGAPAGNRILLTIWDGGGGDTYDFTGYGAGTITPDLVPGEWTTTAAGQRANLAPSNSPQPFARGTVYNAMKFGGSVNSVIETSVGP